MDFLSDAFSALFSRPSPDATPPTATPAPTASAFVPPPSATPAPEASTSVVPTAATPTAATPPSLAPTATSPPSAPHAAASPPPFPSAAAAPDTEDKRFGNAFIQKSTGTISANTCYEGIMPPAEGVHKDHRFIEARLIDVNNIDANTVYRSTTGAPPANTTGAPPANTTGAPVGAPINAKEASVDVVAHHTKSGAHHREGDKFDVFLSHAWKGESNPTSHLVKDLLQKEGLKVWFDEENMEGNLYKAMVDGITNSTLFIPVTSVEYQESENCMKELRFAHQIKKTIVHVSTGFQITDELSFLIGELLYYSIPRDNEKLIRIVREKVREASFC